MPEAVNGARYACQKCMNGHRTKTCQHWENEHDKLAKSVDLSEVAPGESRENIAVFAKTRSAGRPRAADLEKDKQGTTLYVLLKTTVDGKQTCKAIGEIDIDAEGNKKELRKTCCSADPDTPPSTTSHSRSKSTTTSSSTSKKRPLDTQISDISYETTRKNTKHDCSCGSTCTCRFCPQHPNTKATQEVMRQVAGQLQEQYKMKQTGQIEFHQDFPGVVPCGGGQITGENSQIYATDDLTVLESWRQQQDDTGNYITTIPLDFSTFVSPSSPPGIQSPQDVKFSILDSPTNSQIAGDFSGYPAVGDFKISSPVSSPSEMDQYISMNSWANVSTPRTGSMNGSLSHQGDPMYPASQNFNYMPVSQGQVGQPSYTSTPVHAAQNQHFMPQNVQGPIRSNSNSSFQIPQNPNMPSYGPVATGSIQGQAGFDNQGVFQQVPVMNQKPAPSRQGSCCGGSSQTVQPPSVTNFNIQSQPPMNFSQHSISQNFSQPAHPPGSFTHPSPSVSSGPVYESQGYFMSPNSNQINAEGFFSDASPTIGSMSNLDLNDQFWQQSATVTPLNHGQMSFQA